MILGGPNILKPFDFADEDGLWELMDPYFKRTYTGLPPHQTLTITGKVWFFGDSVRNGRLMVNIQANFLRQPLDLQAKAEKLIGKLGGEIDEVSETEFFQSNMKVNLPHGGETLHLELSFYNQQAPNVTFGFRDLTIHLSNSTIANKNSHFFCPTETPIAESQMQVFDPCFCPFNQFLSDDGFCQDCSPNCDICIGPNPEECGVCSLGNHWTGRECTSCHWNCRACTGTTQHTCSVCNFGFYNYGNGSCLETCEWPFRVVQAQDELQCVKACPDGEYAWNHIPPCVKECEPPLVKIVEGNNILICETPCPERDYIYTNGSCISTCPSPLVAVFTDGIRFCKNPCSGGTSQFLYWNRLCLEDCPAPLQIRSEPLVKYCINPCSNPQLYLYNNGSCHSSCRSPLRAKLDSSSIKYCLAPCDLENEYILKDGSCSEECPAPLVRRTEPGAGTHCLTLKGGIKLKVFLILTLKVGMRFFISTL